MERDEESCRLMPGLDTGLEMQYQLEMIKESRTDLQVVEVRLTRPQQSRVCSAVFDTTA